jgi:hypothetical protein
MMVFAPATNEKNIAAKSIDREEVFLFVRCRYVSLAEAAVESGTIAVLLLKQSIAQATEKEHPGIAVGRNLLIS